MVTSPYQQLLLPTIKPYKLNLTVVWDLYCGCTGLNIEAINFLVPLEGLIRLLNRLIKIYKRSSSCFSDSWRGLFL